MANTEYELGLIRTDRGLFIDKGNYVVDPRHKDFQDGADPLGSKDSTLAWQAAIAYADSIGADVYGPPGTFLISGAGLQISSNCRRLICSGKRRTIFLFRPTAHDQACLTFQSLNNSVLYQCALLGGCSFYSDDTTYRKVGLKLVDTSEFVGERITTGPIGNWIDSSTGSIGIYLKGRELTTLSDCDIAANKPIVIGTNPNSAGTLDCDTLTISNPYLLPTGNNAGIEFEDTGLMVQNVRISGAGVCVGGKDFVRITKTAGAAGEIAHGGQTWADIRIDGGIRWENQSATGGYYFNNAMAVGALEGLVIDGARWGTGATCEGVYLRRTYFVKFRDVKYFGSGVALNCDSTCDQLDLDFYAQAGSSVTMTGLTKVIAELPVEGFPIERHTVWIKSAATQLWHVEWGVKGWKGTGTLADDATLSLPTINTSQTLGMVTVAMKGATQHESAIFSVTGTTAKQTTANANAAAADTDTKLCLFMTGAVPTVKNRLGESVTYMVEADWV